MPLSVISADLGYPIFTDSNEKSITLFVSVFTKSDATGTHLHKSSYRLNNCHAIVSFSCFFMLCMIAFCQSVLLKKWWWWWWYWWANLILHCLC